MHSAKHINKFVLSRVRIRVGVFAVVIVVAVLAALALVAGRRGKLLHWAPLPSHCKRSCNNQYMERSIQDNKYSRP